MVKNDIASDLGSDYDNKVGDRNSMKIAQTENQTHQPREPLLILEDQKEIRDRLHSLCAELHLPAEKVENGAEGLELARQRDFSIYIVDLMMPIMGGREFIQELKKIKTDPVILIQSSIHDPETIIEIMKMGVFDYIIKPIDPDQFVQTLRKTIEYKYLRDQERYQRLNADRKIQGQLEWLIYKEKKRTSGPESLEKSAIYNLKTSLSQGGGIGTMISIIDIIQSAMKREGDQYLVPADLMDVLFQNNDIGRQLLQGLDKIVNIIEMGITLQKRDTNEIIEAVPHMVERLEPFLAHKNLKLTYPRPGENHPILVNLSLLSLMVEELVINAIKYSAPNKTINIASGIARGYFQLTVENPVNNDGVPKQYERLVLEPFFRLNPPLDEHEGMEIFGLGLGLTVVEHVISKHNGMFFIQNVRDHTGPEISDCVLAQLLIPIALEGE